MLQISSYQMHVLEEAVIERFENEMLVHCRSFSPEFCQPLKDEQLHVAVNEALKRANQYGFELRGPIRLLIELTFLFGSHFDTDPQYPQFAKILHTPGHQVERAEHLYSEVVDYRQKISWDYFVYADRALKWLKGSTALPPEVSTYGFVAGMLQNLTRIYPQKAATIGNTALEALIHEGEIQARNSGLNADEDKALIVQLMYFFGHGCIDDPLYPWIADSLGNKKHIDAKERVGQLEKNAFAWLEYLLEQPRKGANA
jgi:hypothetical protein